MAKLGAALSYNPFEPAPAEEAKLGEPIDFNPFEAASTPDEKELNLPPLQGTPAPGVPLPTARPAEVPLPTPRPANLGEEAPPAAPLQASIVPTVAGLVGNAPSVPLMQGAGFGGAPVTPVTNAPDIAAAIPGGLQVQKELQEFAFAKNLQTNKQIDALQKKIDAFKAEGGHEDEIDNLQRTIQGLTTFRAPENLVPELAAVQKTEEEIKAQPKTDFSKKYTEATQAGGIKGWITGTYDAIKADPLGASKGFTATTVEGAPQVIATVAGGVNGAVTGALYGAGRAYTQALLEETKKYGWDGDPKKFYDTYRKHEDDIDAVAKANAAVAGTFNAAMGLIPGGNTLGEGVKNVLLKYTPIQVAQGIVENRIATVNKLDPQTGQPVFDANGNPVLVHLEGLKPSEIANMVAQGIITSVPFEARHLLPERGAPAQAQATGEAPPPGAEAGKAPGETPNAPSGAGPEAAAPPKEGRQSTAEYNAAFPVNNDSALMSGFEDDIRSGRMSREDALDRIAKMTPEEAAQKAELFRQVGGKDVEGYKIATDDDAYLENKRKEFGTHPEVATEAPGSQPSPEEPVEARGAASPPPPEAPPVDETTASILKGAGYDVEDVMAMSPTERSAELASAKKANTKPANLTDDERAALSGKPAQAETPTPPAPEAAPATKATELVAQGVEPIEAMKEAAAEPIAAAPIVPPAPEPAPPTSEPVASMEAKAAEPVAAPAAEEAPAVTVPSKRAAPVNFKGLVGFVKSIGGVKEERGELRARDLHRVPGLVRSNGLSIEDAATRAVEEGFYPEHYNQVMNGEGGHYGPTSELIEQFKDDLKNKKQKPVPAEEAAKAREKQLSDEEQFRLGSNETDVRGLLKDMGHTASDDLVHDAATIMLRDNKDAESALHEAAAAHLADALPGEEATIHDIVGDDFWNTVHQHLISKEEPNVEPSPKQEAGPVGGEALQPTEQPAAKTEAEKPSEPIPKIVSEKPTQEAVRAGKEIEGTGLSLEHKKINLSPKLQAKKTKNLMDRYFAPGNIVDGYSGKDKVVSYTPMDDNGRWSVTVQRITPSGLEPPRTHQTMPTAREMRESLGKEVDKDFVVTGDLVKNKALLDKLGFEPVRTVEGIPQRVFIGADPTEVIKGELQPATEAGAEGKPQMVIPGAEKISGGELAQRKADQPLQSKAEQKEPGGLFGDLGQKDLLDLAKEKPVEKPQVLREAPEWAEMAARDINGRVVYHNGDVAIAIGHDEWTCKPIYTAVKKKGDSFIRTKTDINKHDFSKSGTFTPEQAAELRQAKADYIKRDHELWEANPEGPFIGDAQFVVSQSISPEIAGVFDQWAKLMGIEGKIYLVDPEDAAKIEYHGPYKLIQGAVGAKDPFALQIMKGEHFISLPKIARVSRRLETLAHEMGHVLKKEAYESLDDTTKKQIKKEFNTWFIKTTGMTARENIEALRTPVQARLTTINGSTKGGTNIPATRMPGYWRSFDEWFADQVSRWAQTEEKPQSAVETFFSRLAAALKRFYATLAGSKYFPSKTMRDFMNERANRKDNINQGSESDEFGGDHKSYAHNSFDQDSIDEINRMNEANGMTGKEQKAVVKSFEEPKETAFGKLRRGIQDEFAFQRTVQDAIERSMGAPLPDNIDTWMQTNLLPGRVSERMHDLQTNEAEPLFKKMKDTGVTKDELGGYLLAHHALERNEEIAARNPKMPDGGSGIMNKTALEMLDKYQNGPKAKELEELAQDVYAIRDRDMQRRVENGLVSQADADAYKAAAPRYVPLFGFAEREASEDRSSGNSGMNLGKGMSVSPSEWRQMTGRTSIPDNPLMNVILRAQEGIYRIEKNNVAKSLYRLAKSNQNPDLWMVNKPVMKKVVGDDGYVTWNVEGMITPSTVIAKIGGQPYYIRLNNDGLAEAFKKVGLNQLPQFLQKFNELNHFYSQLQTGKNLDFMAKNVSRDVLDALTYTYIRDPKVAARFATSYFPALATAIRHSIGKMSPEQQAIFDEWRLNGGRISYYRGGDIEKIANDMKAIAGKADPITWRSLPAKARRGIWNVLTAIPNAMEKINAPLEEATRMAVYMAAKKSGYSEDKSAMMSLDATVNFNRRGKYTSYANAYKWFFNAALQPGFTWARLLKSPRGRRVAAALVGIGFANGLRNLMVSDDDKMQKGRKNYMNIPEWEKQGNLIVKTGPGEKDYIKIPIGSQLNIPFYLGEKMAALMAGQATGAETAANTASGMFWSAIPVSSGPLAQMIAPSIMQPVIDLFYNQKWTGSPVHPPETMYTKGTPHSEQESKNTGVPFSEFTRWLNNASGGNSAVPGKFDVYPDDVQHLYDFAVGGAGRSATSLYQYVSNLMTGIPSPTEETPLVKGFAPSKWDSSQRYYELHDIVSKQQNEARKAVADYQKDPTPKNFNTMDKVLYDLGATQSNGRIAWDNSDPIKAMRSADKQLKDLRQERMKVKDNTKLPPLMRQQQMDRLDKEMNGVMIDAGRDMSAIQPIPAKGPLSGLVSK
jgi:hypothetical protein